MNLTERQTDAEQIIFFPHTVTAEAPKILGANQATYQH